MPQLQKVGFDDLPRRCRALLSSRLGINGSFFCDQDCFKKNCELSSYAIKCETDGKGYVARWRIPCNVLTLQGQHKLIHNIIQVAARAEEESEPQS